jgi:hypothetical protein
MTLGCDERLDRSPENEHVAIWRRLSCVWLLTIVLNLTGCSGCQKLEQKVSPPVPPVNEVVVMPEASRPEKVGETAEPTSAAVREADTGVKAVSEPAPELVNSNSVGTVSVGTVPGSEIESPAPIALTPQKSNGTQGTGRKPKRSTGTPAEAFAAASELRSQASQATERGKLGAAFELTVRAWEQVREFPGDSECSRLAADLEMELKTLGEQVNAPTVREGNGLTKRLIEN